MEDKGSVVNERHDGRWLPGDDGFAVERVNEIGRCSTAAGHPVGGQDREDFGVDFAQHTVRTLTAAHAARDGTPRAHLVDGYVRWPQSARWRERRCRRIPHGEQVPDDDTAPSRACGARCA